MAGARQPIDLVKAKGKKHLTKKEITDREQREIKAKSDNVVAPSFLSEAEKETFSNIANELLEIGIMSNVDCNALGRYVVAQSNYEKITDKINDTEIGEDILVYEKLCKMQGQFLEQCLKIEKEFGMTISSRCKIIAPKKEEKENPLRKALSGNG